MTTCYLREAEQFWPTSQQALDLHQALPVGTYVIKAHPMRGFFFQLIEDFEVPTKMYGNADRNASRIINTFEDREASTGVLLAGEKGSGKTLLAKSLAVRARALGYPTILINEPLHGESFNRLIHGVQQPAVIIFDEFEKVYDSDEQQMILTLLDGVYPTKKLFVLTCNDRYRVDAHMRNRPGRLYYSIDFVGLEREFIIEYCQDNLLAKQHIDTICSLTVLFDHFNFDMLKALVEEMNRYGDEPLTALELLNIKPTTYDESEYAITIVDRGVDCVVDWPTTARGNPLMTPELDIHYNLPSAGTDGDEDVNACDSVCDSAGMAALNSTRKSSLAVRVTPADCVRIDKGRGVFVFETDGVVVTLTKKPAAAFSYQAHAALLV